MKLAWRKYSNYSNIMFKPLHWITHCQSKLTCTMQLAWKKHIFGTPSVGYWKPRNVSSPGNTPVRLNLQDGRIVCVVEFDLWVPQLSRVYVHHDRGGTWGLSRRCYTHYFLATPPGRAVDEGNTERHKRKMLHIKISDGIYELCALILL